MKRCLVIKPTSCSNCIFANRQGGEVIACWYPGKSDRMTTIGSGESIPDWCPLPVANSWQSVVSSFLRGFKDGSQSSF